MAILRSHDICPGCHQRECFGACIQNTFITKDSGERKEFASGMQRDTTTGKVRPDLVLDGPMFLRWAALMARGAEKYEARNWMKATGQEEIERFRESAFRHFVQWWLGLNPEEDHAAAIFFNVNGAEYVKERNAL